ncbi:MAG: hypothetical protein ACTIJJ_07815 [Galactobacter sp.]|uniref:hypothetical protein n=1 Tax=Galactobacter sp. TaxID=2676125 RepID=UPI0025C67917|nr:hypothetical protein [Galactobacter sp.]
MSIFAARIFLAVTFLVAVACAAWFVIVWSEVGPWSDASVWPAVICVVACVMLVVALMFFPRFVEATADDQAVSIRRVLGPRRQVRFADLDEVVVLKRLLLPSRGTSASTTVRILLRQDGRTVASFSPRGSGLVSSLENHGPEPLVIHEPLTPSQARRRWRGAVNSAELLSVAGMWAAVVVPIAVVLWVILGRGN